MPPARKANARARPKTLSVHHETGAEKQVERGCEGGLLLEDGVLGVDGDVVREGDGGGGGEGLELVECDLEADPLCMVQS
jgi:hypothetical protein